jgi:hypothetical protein
VVVHPITHVGVSHGVVACGTWRVGQLVNTSEVQCLLDQALDIQAMKRVWENAWSENWGWHWVDLEGGEIWKYRHWRRESQGGLAAQWAVWRLRGGFWQWQWRVHEEWVHEEWY